MDIGILILQLIGTVSFAVSGAMTAMRKGMDVLGVTVLGLTTAVGGGVIPMEAALAMAAAAGYEGFCSAEHYGVADQWDFIVKSAAWMAEHM